MKKHLAPMIEYHNRIPPVSPDRSSETRKSIINTKNQNTRDFNRVLKLSWASTRHTNLIIVKVNFKSRKCSIKKDYMKHVFCCFLANEAIL